MRRHARVLAAAVAAGVFALSFLALPEISAADDKEKDEAKAAVLKLADALKGNDEAAAKKEVEALKKMELADIMILFKPRGKGGLGIGAKPGAIMPDGIEMKIIGMARKELPKKEITGHAEDFEKMAYIVAAIADVAVHKCPIDKKQGEMDPKDWKQWSEEMKETAIALSKAAKAKDPKAAKTAASKLNATCNNCHGTFRD